jgi:hypothetical protein
MSPRDSFEYRLKSSAGLDSDSCYDIPINVKNGLSYHILDAGWISPKDNEFRAFVEDDERYRVHWDEFVSGEDGTFSGSLMFLPKDPLPHMDHFNSQTKNSQTESMTPVRFGEARQR